MTEQADRDGGEQSLVVEVHNTHVPDCGPPPQIVKQSDDAKYVGYFENRHTEQWVVEIDRQAKTGVLRSGDVGWEQSFPISDDRLDPDLILSHEEAAWLINCWRAATGGRLQVTTIPVTDDLLGWRGEGQ
jgi:hypothetical protein